MYRAILHVRNARDARTNPARHGGEIKKAETDLKIFAHDLYLEIVIFAVKIAAGVSLLKGSLLGHHAIEIGKDLITEAAPYGVEHGLAAVPHSNLI